jgi:hypothetical protein
MNTLVTREKLAGNAKVANQYQQFGALLTAIKEKDLPIETTDFINKEIEQINALAYDDKSFSKTIKASQKKIVQLLEKKHKIVPKKYYTALWMVLGMSAFGIPMGVAFGLSMGNIGLLGIGLPIGMGIGVGVGSYLDKKALTEGRQLDVDLKY